ncbi:hypothetical protein GGX14DRAFT_654078 [Mycena pura]|uniref:Uncharacterized protein n=1 Tax=Mycena pura TaxID=153505 RepID=A0AAD6V3V2_9AGAR|nr:hypothetical protein GGX14DRAFT_654078 [Mycena pura]
MSAGRPSTTRLSLSELHPLSDELSSLQAAVSRFQNEAHSSSIKLQRHALDTSTLSDRIAQLESEKAVLTSELAILRDNPAPSPSSPSADTVAELTLSLRRLNAKLSLTEAALEEHTRALAETTALATRNTHAANEAYALAARARGREEEGRQREAALERAVAQAKEETRLSDRVVEEYAALVRTLDGRSPPPSATGWAADTGDNPTGTEDGGNVTLVERAGGVKPKDLLAESKAQLSAQAAGFSEQCATLEARVAAVEGERDVAHAQLAAARMLTVELGNELARAKFSAEQARVDDRSAAGMVERYMTFTQQTTTALHASLASLRARHTATLHTLQSSLSTTTNQLTTARAMEARLRAALDESGGALVRETVGRRREVGMRVRMVGREERAVEGLRAALGQAELLSAADGDEGETSKGTALARLIADVRRVLEMLDGDTGSAYSAAGAAVSAGMDGRMLLLENAVEMLSGELEEEMRRRVEAERVIRDMESHEPLGNGHVRMPGEEKDDTVAKADVSDSEPFGPAIGKSSSSTNSRTSFIDVEPVAAQSDWRPPPVSETLHPSSHLSPDGQLSGEDLEGTESGVPRAEDDAHIPQGADVSVQDDLRAADGEPEAEAEGDGEPTHLANDADNASPSVNAVHASVAASLGGVGLSAGAGPASVSASRDTDMASHLSSDVGLPPVEPSVTLLSRTEPEPEPEPAPAASIAFPSADTTLAPDVVPSQPDAPSAVPHADTTSIRHVDADADADTPAPHPLLAELVAAGKRYDKLQRAFRDCHLALQDLRAALAAPAPASLDAGEAVLRSAVERLHDYTEDARVELEICVADGRVLTHGWETLVLLPGPQAGGTTSALLKGSASKDDAAHGDADVRSQIAAFVEREARSQAAFQRKLADVEHDIAAVKHAVYMPPSPSPPPPPTSPAAPSSPERDAGGWAAWLRGGGSGSGSGARTPPSPGYGEAPTFGSVMTSPRLRHSASAARLVQRREANPFESLGLRVPMPAYIPQQPQPQPQSQPPAARQRTISGVYMLGLGVGRGQGGRRPSGLAVSPEIRGTAAAAAVETEADGDVE